MLLLFKDIYKFSVFVFQHFYLQLLRLIRDVISKRMLPFFGYHIDLLALLLGVLLKFLFSGLSVLSVLHFGLYLLTAHTSSSSSTIWQ